MFSVNKRDKRDKGEMIGMNRHSTICKLFCSTMALLLAGSMVACSDPAPDNNASGGSASGKTKLSITFRDDGVGAEGSLWKWFQDAYASYPKKDEIELDIAPITASEGDYFAKIALSLQSPTTAPDIVCQDTFQLPSDASAGYLTALDHRLMTAYPDWTDGSYFEALKKGVTGPDGKIYGIPYTTDTRGLWYNKQIFQQAGLPTEWEPKNWDDILAACATIKEKVPDVVPFWCNSAIATGEATSMQTYEMLLYGTGERLMQDDQWIVSSSNIQKSLSFLDDIYRKGFGPPLPLVLNGQASNTSAREYLPQGKLAILLDGFWIHGNYQETGASPWPEYGEVLGLAPMPTSDGANDGTVTLAGGWGLSIPEQSDAKDAAFDFILHCMSKEVYIPAVVSMGSLATRADVVDDPRYAKLPFMQTATNFLDTAFFRPANEQYPTVSTHIQTMVESVVTGTPPADAMAQYALDVTGAVGEDKTIKLP